MYSAVVVKEVLQRRQSHDDKERSGWPSEGDNDQLRAINKADPLTTTEEAASMFQHLEQTGKVKKLSRGLLRGLTGNQKNCPFEVSSSLILHNNEPFLDWIAKWDGKWIFYDSQQPSAQWLDQEKAPKHFPN